MKKAYDRLNQYILILKLYNIGIPRDVDMMFVFYFQHSCAILIRNGVSFSMFSVKSGVGQGGCLQAGYLICI